MIAPDIPKAQLIADERAAERAVLEAESAWLMAQAVGGDVTGTKGALDAARAASRATRQRMVDGLAAWTRYAAYQEAVAHAEANGVPIPPVGAA